MPLLKYFIRFFILFAEELNCLRMDEFSAKRSILQSIHAFYIICTFEKPWPILAESTAKQTNLMAIEWKQD